MPYNLDIRTLCLICGIVSIFLSFPLGYTVLYRRVYPGFRLWAVAFIINGVGFILLGHRGLLPDFLTVVVANTLIVSHLAMISRGISTFTGQLSNIWLDILPVACVVVAFVYLTYVKPDVNMRIILISIAIALLFFRCGLLKVRSFSSHLSTADRVLISIFFFSAACFFLRAFVTFFLGERLDSFMDAGLFQASMAVLYCVASILIMTGLIIINNQKIEIELLESEARYRLLFDKSPLGVVQLDKAGRIVDANEALCELLKTSKDSLIGSYLSEKITNVTMRQAIEDALSGRDASFEGECGPATAGKQMVIRVLARTIHTVDGEPAGAVGIFEDVTETRNTMLELQEKEKLKSVLEIAGAVCHELNQPLMAVTGYTELLLMQLSEEEDVRDKFLRMLQQIDRMKQITEKLMGITRYKTKGYLDGRIVDIEGSSGDAPPEK